MPSFSRGKQYSIHHDKSNGISNPTGSAATLPTSIRSSKRKKKRFGTLKARSSTRSRKRAAHTTKNDHKQPLIATDSMVLHELVPSLPMPGEMELNILFAQIVVCCVQSNDHQYYSCCVHYIGRIRSE